MIIGINARLLIAGRMEGLARYTWEITRQMILNHPEDQFILFFDRKPDPQFKIAENVTLVKVNPQARHPILFYLWYEWQLPRYVRNYQVDVFFSADNFMSLSLEIPTALVVHDLAFDVHPEFIGNTVRRYYHKFMPKFIAKADHLFTVSNYIKEEIVRNYKVRPQSIDTTYNALPKRNVGGQLTSTVDFDYFVCVSSIHPRKNQAILIEAFDRFKRESGSDFKLMIIGRVAWDYPEYKKALSSTIYRDDIIHKANVSDEQIDHYIGSSKGLVYPSIYEGFGIPILEGFANGVPVITSNVTSMPEVAGDAALLVNPYSSEEIATAFKTITNQDVAQDLISKGKERLRSFSWKTSADIIYDRLSILSA